MELIAENVIINIFQIISGEKKQRNKIVHFLNLLNDLR